MSSPRTDSTVYVHEVGLVCALGEGAAAARRALAAQCSPLSSSSPFWPRSLPQGLVTSDLPSLRDFPLRHRTRCNALLLAAYRQIEAGVRRAVTTTAPPASRC